MLHGNEFTLRLHPNNVQLKGFLARLPKNELIGLALSSVCHSVIPSVSAVTQERSKIESPSFFVDDSFYAVDVHKLF
jgi:hypothetical protein